MPLQFVAQGPMLIPAGGSFNGSVAGEVGWAGYQTNLVAAWPMNTGHIIAGPNVEDTVGAVDFPLDGTNTAAAGPSGDAGYARAFDGATTWVVNSATNGTPITIEGTWSIAFWAYSGDNSITTGGNRQEFYSFRPAGTHFIRICMQTGIGAGSVGIGVTAVSTPSQFSFPANTLQNAQWTHFGFVQSSFGSMTGYVNGVATAFSDTTTAAGDPGFSHQSIGGFSSTTGQLANGSRMAEVCAWSVALTAPQMLQVKTAF